MIFGTMTPLKGLTWVYNEIYLNQSNDNEVWHEEMEWADNPYLDKDEIEAMTKSLSADELESRRYGKFMQCGGMVYSEFDENVHVLDPFEVPKDWQDNISIDPGLNNPLSAHWYARDYDGNVYVIAEHFDKGKDVYYHAQKIKEICGDVGRMDFEDASEAAKQLEDGDFLPQLKFDALKELEQRMSKIKTDECGLLVSKLLNAFDEAGVTESKRCHFYPAKRVWQKQAEPEETAVFEGAVDNFANGIGKFEYPVLLVDKSKDESGKEGVLLTPENLYYSAWMTSYYIPVMDIESIQAVTGLLNRGIYVYQKNGSKTKLPLAVEHEEMEKFAKVLEDFVRYLQEKPFSRKESYLAKEKHDTICCYRCGYIYKGVGVCPRCGYKQNE